MKSEDLEQLDKLKKRIPYDEDIFEAEDIWEQVLISLLEDSKSIALETLFPYADDYSEIELPKSKYNWQLRCCVELYNLADKQGYTSYSENSLNWTKLSDGLSNSLMNKLTSRVGVPKKKEVSEAV